MPDYQKIQDELRAPAKALRGHIPEVYSGFVNTSRAALSDGALPAKFKELLALAIAVVKRCDGCIVAHSKGALRAGATEEEVAEALGVTILMDGATATVYAPRALEAYQQFKQSRSQEAL
jgi:AhpD family alkylhydroperoxidase